MRVPSYVCTCTFRGTFDLPDVDRDDRIQIQHSVFGFSRAERVSIKALFPIRRAMIQSINIMLFEG